MIYENFKNQYIFKYVYVKNQMIMFFVSKLMILCVNSNWPIK